MKKATPYKVEDIRRKIGAKWVGPIRREIEDKQGLDKDASAYITDRQISRMRVVGDPEKCVYIIRQIGERTALDAPKVIKQKRSNNAQATARAAYHIRKRRQRKHRDPTGGYAPMVPALSLYFGESDYL